VTPPCRVLLTLPTLTPLTKRVKVLLGARLGPRAKIGYGLCLGHANLQLRIPMEIRANLPGDHRDQVVESAVKCVGRVRKIAYQFNHGIRVDDGMVTTFVGSRPTGRETGLGQSCSSCRKYGNKVRQSQANLSTC